MDFFQAQDRARGRTSLLVGYFTAAVIGIVLVLYAVALFAFNRVNSEMSGPEGYATPFAWWDAPTFAAVALGTVAVIGLSSLFKSIALRAGGSAVADSLGGVRVAPNTTDLRERRLVNVVEEMAIASGVRVPAIYVLPNEGGINAFAAGWTPDDAAIAVTRGALDTLTRDELQGVIAHEFSHILNGDMRLNIRLIGLLFGILVLTVIGRVILRTAGSGSRSSRNGKGNAAPLLILGLALVIVGWIGVFFGRLIQAAVSRQREFLADASAVQFTRNPGGIAGALKKIGGLSHGSRVTNAHATESSHQFFANALTSAAGAWATHPPLVDRIRAIEPAFDGRFPAVGPLAPESPAAAPASRATSRRPSGLRAEEFIAALAAGAEAAPAQAHRVLDAIPAALREAAHDPAAAPALLLGMLAHAGDEATAARQRHILDQVFDAATMVQALQFGRAAAGLEDDARLALVDLTLTAVRQLDAEAVTRLLAVMDEMIAADYRTTAFEFALARIIRRALGRHAAPGGTGQPAMPSFSKAPAPDVAALLDAVARAGNDGDPTLQARAYAAGARRFGLVADLAAAPREPSKSLTALALPLQRLERTPMSERARVLDALAHAAAADGVVHPEEYALLRAFAAALDCPAPLLAGGENASVEAIR